MGKNELDERMSNREQNIQSKKEFNSTTSNKRILERVVEAIELEKDSNYTSDHTSWCQHSKG